MASPLLRIAALLVVLLEVTTMLLVLPGAARAKEENPAPAAKNDGRQKIQEMKVEAPIMTEEDQHGYNMPERYLCDACKAVVFHLNQTLVRRQPRSRRLKEWEYTELFDEICANEFEGYGIKLIGGENVLSGPALTNREEEVKPGGAMIQMGGDNWKKRMGEVCRRFVYEKVGEEELYQTFYKKGELSDSMCFQLTRDCSLGPKAPPKKKEEASGEKKKKGAEKLIKREPSKPGKDKEPSAAAKKEEKKSSLKGSAAAPSNAKKASGGAGGAGGGEGGRPVDVTYFLTKLAVEHGLPPTEYTKNRSKEEWERAMVALAGRIFAKESSSSSSSSSSSAGGAEDEAIAV